MAKIILAKTIVSIARDLLGTGLAESRSSRACSKVKTQDKHTHKDEDKDEDNTKTQTQNGSPRSARITPPCTSHARRGILSSIRPLNCTKI